jgi:hypothetical protein
MHIWTAKAKSAHRAGVENGIFVYKYSRKLGTVMRVSSESCFPSWHPKTSGGDYIPSYGVEEYLAATIQDVRECFEESQRLHATKPVYNLCKRHRDALSALRERRDIIFVDADKNLGLV